MAMEPISDYSEGLLKYYFGAVCEHLTGRKTRIVWSERVYGLGRSTGPEAGEIWGGMARKSANGGATIKIKRGLGWTESFAVFLHECGHVLKTYDTLPDPRLRFYTRKHKYETVEQYSETPDEISAEKQAEIWQTWARAKAGTSRIVPQLEALLEYPNG